MGKHIFISYSRKDTDFVKKLATDLRKAGANIWLDVLDIPVGANWDDAVEEALDSCESFMIMLSPNSVSSGSVKDELAVAIDSERRIIPVLIKSCKIPLRIRRKQYADFSSDYSHGFKNLQRELNVKTADAETKTEFDVVLKEVGSRQIQLIKVVRAITGLGLKDVKELVEGGPKAVKKGVSQSEADDLKKQLEELGATVEIALNVEPAPETVTSPPPAKKKPKTPTPKLAAEPKRQSQSQPVFRSKGENDLSEEAVKKMLQKHDFYCSEYDRSKTYCNPCGKGFANAYEARGEVVLDKASGLIWQQSGSGQLNYASAETYISDLNKNNYARYEDWRLPTLEEAMSLVEPGQTDGNLYMDPVFDDHQFGIWTADRYSAERAWVVQFSYGYSIHSNVNSSNRCVRAVRSGLSRPSFGREH